MSNTKTIAFAVLVAIVFSANYAMVKMSFVVEYPLQGISKEQDRLLILDMTDTKKEDKPLASPTTTATITAFAPRFSNTTHDGFRHVQDLHYCAIEKVSSSANKQLLRALRALPLSSSPRLDRFSFAIIRDPLDRLYSGYWNKCLHQLAKETQQCPRYPSGVARKMPPTFYAWLRRQRGDGGRAFNKNPHFRAMSKFCPLHKMDMVLHMSSPNFNRNVANLWKALGVNHTLVDERFPTETVGARRIMSHYSNTSHTGSADKYDCQTLKLALPLVKHDYQGRYKNFFPMPTWATEMHNSCNNITQQA